MSARGACTPTNPLIRPRETSVSQGSHSTTGEPQSHQAPGKEGGHRVAPPSTGASRAQATPVQNQLGGRKAQRRLHSLCTDRRLHQQAGRASSPRSIQPPPHAGELLQAALGSQS
ncbi:hypothetical protein NDU88_005348 [Pleurodeles waltl]|uniref:Uncharacterized protein n=1 Tax=Pleurodeles waltl TaxID=8319 RepID=A0AAV7MW31_PLEWA|nr:hypothetical protein NDU88_005348 [Pleurodeles waltl]